MLALSASIPDLERVPQEGHRHRQRRVISKKRRVSPRTRPKHSKQSSSIAFVDLTKTDTDSADRATFISRLFDQDHARYSDRSFHQNFEVTSSSTSTFNISAFDNLVTPCFEPSAPYSSGASLSSSSDPARLFDLSPPQDFFAVQVDVDTSFYSPKTDSLPVRQPSVPSLAPATQQITLFASMQQRHQDEPFPSVSRGQSVFDTCVQVVDGVELDHLKCERLSPIIASILQQVCDRNKERGRAPLRSDVHPYAPLTLHFRSTTVSPISIETYASRIQRYADCSPSCLLVALMLLDRVIAEYDGFNLNCFNVHRLFLTATVLAIKMYDRCFYKNSFYAKVGGITCSELNVLEVSLLRLLRFDLVVSEELYGIYYSEVVKHGITIGVLSPWCSDRLQLLLDHDTSDLMQMSPSVSAEHQPNTAEPESEMQVFEFDSKWPTDDAMHFDCGESRACVGSPVHVGFESIYAEFSPGTCVQVGMRGVKRGLSTNSQDSSTGDARVDVAQGLQDASVRSPPCLVRTGTLHDPHFFPL